MAGKMTKDEADRFRSFLRQCTDAQVQGVYDKEKQAGRTYEALLALLEGMARKIDVEK